MIAIAQAEMPVFSKQFYVSSNGDTWDLMREGEHVYVLHRPNLSSGGTQKQVELSAFFALEPHTAQNVALVRLIGTLAGDREEAELKKSDIDA